MTRYFHEIEKSGNRYVTNDTLQRSHKKSAEQQKAAKQNCEKMMKKRQ